MSKVLVTLNRRPSSIYKDNESRINQSTPQNGSSSGESKSQVLFLGDAAQQTDGGTHGPVRFLRVRH